MGERLHGKWRIDELLGLGGVASVYSATDRQGNRVAIKLMHGYWVDEPSVCERFLREGYSANRVKHPAVISAFADGVTEGGTPFLVLELLEGRTVEAELLIHGKMTPLRVLHIADQLLDALVAAHAINVLHRDLKPENLFLVHDDSLRVLDFGIARMHDTQNLRLTQEGRAMGTPGFMAPEQARGEWDTVDARVDLWSVGACMFTLLTGREVHAGRTQQELLVKSMTCSADPIREVEPSVPARVAAIIDRSLAFDPEDRWPSAHAMQRAVRAAMAFATDASDADAAPTLRPVTTDPQPHVRHSAPPAPHQARGWSASWRHAIIAAACVASVAAVASDIHDRSSARSTLHALAPSIAHASQQAAAFEGLDPATLDPATLDPATLDPATLDPAAPQPDGLPSSDATASDERGDDVDGSGAIGPGLDENGALEIDVDEADFDVDDALDVEVDVVVTPTPSAAPTPGIIDLD